MSLRITVLCDNTVGALSGTIGEHGFAALIEKNDAAPLLFDTGQGLGLLHNAARMGKNLAAVEKVVISHGHYDHSGGLLPLLKTHGGKEVYGDSRIFAPRYRVKDTGEAIPIGIPFSKAELEEIGASFRLSSGLQRIDGGIFLSGEIPRRSFEKGDQGLYCDCTGKVRDSTTDDQSLIIETAKGLVLLLGCCHAGLVNTLQHVAAVIGKRDFYAVVGGTHLGFCDSGQLEGSIAAIREFGIRKLAVSHCTGFAASARLAREFPKEFQLAMVGYTLEV
jgi:7,8-dihydropterin-6-yl-methyl-4-(beta-D-ribofuranosyl)aminobenzene 5'-phosphate synthase